MNATIKVKAFEKVRNVKVYWQKPSGLEIASMSGGYNFNGSFGNFYWWRFNLINASEEKFIYFNLTPTGVFSMLDAFNIGLDPR
ncbi:MAG: hypothetical protein NZ872_06145, partial [Archaeoglobaceae archaeon]|nr:hypothetical protein [Archaeoglobaceae archaeon]MDW8128781.1 hypothetical protein [Archaeoglobaceae archaeon]